MFDETQSRLTSVHSHRQWKRRTLSYALEYTEMLIEYETYQTQILGICLSYGEQLSGGAFASSCTPRRQPAVPKHSERLLLGICTFEV